MMKIGLFPSSRSHFHFDNNISFTSPNRPQYLLTKKIQFPNLIPDKFDPDSTHTKTLRIPRTKNDKPQTRVNYCLSFEGQVCGSTMAAHIQPDRHIVPFKPREIFTTPLCGRATVNLYAS